MQNVKQMLQDIPPRSRLIMLVSVIVVILMVWLVIRNIGSSQPPVAESAGEASVRVDLDSRRARETERSQEEVQEQTETARRLDDLRRQDIERRRQQDSSFIEQVRLDNLARAEEDGLTDAERRELERQAREAAEDDDDEADEDAFRNRLEEARQREMERRRQQQGARDEALRRKLDERRQAGRQQRGEDGENPYPSGYGPDGRDAQGRHFRDGYYYYDESGELVVNERPIRQRELVHVRETGQLMDMEAFVQAQRDRMRNESPQPSFDLASRAPLHPGDPRMDVGSGDGAASEQGRRGDDELSARDEEEYDQYFRSGPEISRRGRDDAIVEHRRLTEEAGGSQGGRGNRGHGAGFAPAGGVSRYDRQEAAIRDDKDRLDVTAGDIFYAELEIGVNTDEISPVRATVIEEGPLKGARLIGIPSRSGESAIIEFRTLSLDGREYDVDVVALDVQTMRTALADHVNHHTFSRYFKLATAAAMQGYAEALSSSRTVERSDGSTETIQDALPDTSDQLAVAAGSVGEAMIPHFEQEFNRQPTVRVDAGQAMGIMFMSGMDLD